jgi:hypothetical protein
MAQLLTNNRWSVNQTEFATRIIVPDIKGFFKGLISPLNSVLVIEPGTRALFIEEGVIFNELPSGSYTLENLLDRCQFWRKKQSTVFLTRSEDIPFESHLSGLPCLEGVCFDVSIRWSVQTSNVLFFMQNLMGANDQFSIAQLYECLAPILHQSIRDAIGHLEYDVLVAGSLIESISENIRSLVEVKLARYGLALGDVLSIIANAQDGGVSQRKGEQWLASRENQLQKAANQIENEALQFQAQDMRQKVDLRVGLRSLVSEDNLNRIKSREDFERAIDEVDRNRLMRVEEKELLIAAYEERKEDHASLREHWLSLLDIQREQEIDELRLSIDHVLRIKTLNKEIEQARLSRSADAEKWQSELEQELKSAEHRRRLQADQVKSRWERIREARKQKRDDSWEALLHAQRSESIKADIEIQRANRQRQLAIVSAELENRLAQEKLEIQKRQELWEIEARERKSSTQLERLQKIQSMNTEFAERQQRLQSEMENLKADNASKRELERIQAMRGVGTEVLIAVSNEGNAALLADLKKHEAIQDAVKAQAVNNSTAELNAERLKLYEQMNATERAKAEAIAEAYKLALQTQQASVQQMIGGLAQAATPPTHVYATYPTTQKPLTHTVPPPMPVAVAPSPTHSEVWHVSVNGNPGQPLSWTQLQYAIQSGQVTPTTMVWKTGMASWSQAQQIPELSGIWNSPPAPPPLP